MRTCSARWARSCAPMGSRARLIAVKKRLSLHRACAHTPRPKPPDRLWTASRHRSSITASARAHSRASRETAAHPEAPDRPTAGRSGSPGPHTSVPRTSSPAWPPPDPDPTALAESLVARAQRSRQLSRLLKVVTRCVLIVCTFDFGHVAEVHQGGCDAIAVA